MSRITEALAKVKLVNDTKQRPGSTRLSRRRLVVTPGLVEKDSGQRLADLCKKNLEPDPEVLLENRIILGTSDHRNQAVDDYKMLRTKVLRRLSANHWRSIAVTSTAQGEGKTLTALNLGISISRDRNFDVVVVDADLRSPSLHTCLGIEPDVGLTDYLEDRAELGDILVRPGMDGFAIIPTLEATENSAEALVAQRMANLVGELQSLSKSVIVIYDLPPLVVDDALAFAPMVDAMMLVFRAGKTTRDDAAAAKELTAELPIIGCVMNADESSGGGVAYY